LKDVSINQENDETNEVINAKLIERGGNTNIEADSGKGSAYKTILLDKKPDSISNAGSDDSRKEEEKEYKSGEDASKDPPKAVTEEVGTDLLIVSNDQVANKAWGAPTEPRCVNLFEDSEGDRDSHQMPSVSVLSYCGPCINASHS
jgi:hypothetical protein